MGEIKIKNGEIVNIRIVFKEDAKYLIDYISKIGGESDFLTFGKNEYDVTIEKQKEIIEEHIDTSNKLLMIAEVDNKIVGSLNYSGGSRERTQHTGDFGVSVRKEYWDLGIGKELIKYMIVWAREGDIIRKINLKVREDHKAAINLYEKLGFKQEGIISREFYIGYKYYSAVLMGLEI